MEEEDLQSEQYACQRSLEDAGYCSGGAASDQDRDVAVIEIERPADIAADSGSRIDDRRLGTHGTAETNRNG